MNINKTPYKIDVFIDYTWPWVRQTSFWLRDLKNELGETHIRFIPKPNAFDYDYNLKTVENTFNSNIGFGSQPVGFTSLSSSIGLSPADSTTTIIGVDSNKYESFYTKNQLINETTNEMIYQGW